MLTSFLNGDAKKIPVTKLKIPKARELAAFLKRPSLQFVKLLYCEISKSGVEEAITFQVEVELGQKKVYDIRQYELIQVIFDPKDKQQPVVLPLRSDFPTTVPHQNQRTYDRPRSLCLDEEPYTEQKLRWSALAFVERIREWFRLTAVGKLHDEDQPLEPLLFGVNEIMVLPHEFLGQTDANKPSPIVVRKLNNSEEKPVYRLYPNCTDEKKPLFIATVFKTQPIEHGVVHSQPANLHELHAVFQRANYDLLGEMSARLHHWIVQKTAGEISDSKIVFLAVFPKKRQADAPSEYPDVWVFCSTVTVHQISVALGVKDEKKGFSGIIIGEKQIAIDVSLVKKIGIFPMRPVYTLTPAGAANFNGFDTPVTKRIVAIGMGALGSQIFNNMMRSGCGEWTLVDKDTLLPHNCARHALPGNAVGFNKGDVLALVMNTTIEGTSGARSIPVDVFEPNGRKEELSKALTDSEVILDFSASVAVARHLADDITSKARRISAFLNPSGTDLVVLAEDEARKYPLVWIEMEYYRLLANENSLSGHLAGDVEQVRYARSCGDVSSRINQNIVALHAAIGSQVLRQSLEKNTASINVFRADPDNMTVRKFVFEPTQFIAKKVLDWTVCISKAVLKKVHCIRKECLPNETGGVLIGYFDRQHYAIYIVDALPAPQDSIERPILFIRGIHGLQKEISRIKKATMSHLDYVGEWHSHPPRCSPELSGIDRRELRTLTEEMSAANLPALMLIVADRNRQKFFIG
jgi:integrative and conjugative element protein (TIGR02256 family)